VKRYLLAVVTTVLCLGVFATAAAASTVVVRKSARFTSGTLSTHVQLQSEKMVRMTVTLRVQAARSGTGYLYVSVCAHQLYVPCNDEQQVHAFRYHEGANYVRWRTSMSAARAIDSCAASVYDDIGAVASLAFANTELRS